jgi:hypothetical protein
MLESTTFQECYDNFILQLKIIFTDIDTNKMLDDIKNISSDDKLNRGKMFVESITSDFFDDFIRSKIKIFSHKNENTKKISESLLDSKLCLKKLLNNQPDIVKKVIWLKIHIIYMSVELLKPVEEQNTEQLNALNKLVNKVESSDSVSNEQTNPTNPTNKLKDMLGVDVNEETTGMIDDIVSSFEKVLSGDATSNPFSGIMEISQKISVKYADKINKGDIELDKLMKSISQKVPGMESMLNGMMNDKSEGGLGGLGSMMGGMMGGDNKKPKEKIIIDDDFSTADVQVGINNTDDKKSINIGNVLKIADQFGVIPGGKQPGSDGKSGTDTLPDLSGLGLGDIPHLGKMMEMMGKLGKVETQEDTDALKLEMDTFLQSELGLDVNKLNKELENVTNNLTNNLTSANE